VGGLARRNPTLLFLLRGLFLLRAADRNLPGLLPREPQVFVSYAWGDETPEGRQRAKVDSRKNRLLRAVYWKQEEEELMPLVQAHVKAVGTEFFRKFKFIGDLARNASNMLEHLVAKLQPRDFERQAAEGFQEVLNQIGRSG
jgi:hypothetical protein